MPIHKFRGPGEMAPPPLRRLDPENFRRAHALSELAYRLHPWPLTPGVHKRRSLAERDPASQPAPRGDGDRSPIVISSTITHGVRRHRS